MSHLICHWKYYIKIKQCFNGSSTVSTAAANVPSISSPVLKGFQPRCWWSAPIGLETKQATTYGCHRKAVSRFLSKTKSKPDQPSMICKRLLLAANYCDDSKAWDSSKWVGSSKSAGIVGKAEGEAGTVGGSPASSSPTAAALLVFFDFFWASRVMKRSSCTTKLTMPCKRSLTNGWFSTKAASTSVAIPLETAKLEQQAECMW